MWPIYALAGPVLWAVSTHIDKYLVEKYFKRSNTAVLMVFTALMGLVLMPVIWLFRPEVVGLSPMPTLVVMTSGMLYMAALLFYLQALQKEEASVVSPLFQASTVWAFLLAYFFLGERLTVPQMLGGVLVVAAGVLMSLDTSFRFRKVKLSFVLQMLACTFVLALSYFVFKFFAVRDDDFWTVTFWTFAGHGLFGLVLIAVPGHWSRFIALLKKNPGPVLAINGSNELINLGGGLAVRYASLFAPLALVQAVSGTTTLFVFTFGIALTRFFPSLGREDLSGRNLLQKSAAAVLVAGGIALMNV